MTDQERLEIKQMVHEAVAYQFRNAADASLPIIELLLEAQKSLAMLVDGQALIERHLAGAFDDDDEPWKGSLGGDEE